jgi:hypothetical protein
LYSATLSGILAITSFTQFSNSLLSLTCNKFKASATSKGCLFSVNKIGKILADATEKFTLPASTISIN